MTAIASKATQKLKLYLKNLYIDYFEVFKDVRRSARARPIKASLYGGSILFVLNLFRVNEGLMSYRSEVISACNRIGAVTEGSRNPESQKFVQTVGELNGHGLLRYNCKYLNPSIKEFVLERIVDWGLMGRWLRLEFKMRDYDINEEEYNEFSLNPSETAKSSQ